MLIPVSSQYPPSTLSTLPYPAYPALPCLCTPPGTVHLLYVAVLTGRQRCKEATREDSGRQGTVQAGAGRCLLGRICRCPDSLRPTKVQYTVRHPLHWWTASVARRERRGRAGGAGSCPGVPVGAPGRIPPARIATVHCGTDVPCAADRRARAGGLAAVGAVDVSGHRRAHSQRHPVSTRDTLHGCKEATREGWRSREPYGGSGRMPRFPDGYRQPG